MVTGIAGAKGFIGSYLSRHLTTGKPGAIRLLTRDATGSSALDHADWMCGDLRSSADCERFAAGLDAICYLAHTNSPVDSDMDQISDALCNLVPLLTLIQAIQNIGSKPHIVYFSSGGAVYSSKHEREPYRETDVCAPLSSYGIQKLAAEHYLRLAAHRGYLTATVLRVGNAYGTLLPRHRRQGLIGVAINNILNRQPVRIFGDVNNVRDYVHLEDVCGAVGHALEPRGEFNIVNIGSGVGHSVWDVLHLIEDCYGAPLEIQTDDSCGQLLTDWIVLDTAKALEEYGWSPAIDLRSGINEMLSGWLPQLQAGVVTAT